MLEEVNEENVGSSSCADASSRRSRTRRLADEDTAVSLSVDVVIDQSVKDGSSPGDLAFDMGVRLSASATNGTFGDTITTYAAEQGVTTLSLVSVSSVNIGTHFPTGIPSPLPTPAPSTSLQPSIAPTPFPTITPSAMPVVTPRPTVSPTFTRDLIVKAGAVAVLYLSGDADASDFGADESEAFTKAIVSSVSYVSSIDEVEVVEVSDYTTSRRRRRQLNANTSANQIMVNYTLTMELDDTGWPSASLASGFPTELMAEIERAFSSSASSNTSFEYYLIENSATENATALVGATVNTAATISELEQSWWATLYTAETFSPTPLPGLFGLTPASVQLAAATTSAIVAGAVAGSIGASVGSSLGGSMGGGGGGGGDLVSMIYQVQFMSQTAQLSVPLGDTFRGFGASFTWINLQIRLPLSFRFGGCRAYVMRTDDGADDSMDDLDDDSDNDDDSSSTASATQEYIASLGMSPAEMLVGNLAMGLLCFSTFVVLHKAMIRKLERLSKTSERWKKFKLPLTLAFPAPEVMAFFLYYPGLVQSGLLAFQTSCTPWPYRALAFVAVFGCSGGIMWLASLVMFGRHAVPFKMANEDHDPNEGKHVLFIIKSENHESVGGRYRRLFRNFDRKEHGRWVANSPQGEVMVNMFDTLFKKFGPAGIILYFGDAMRKLLFMVLIALTAGAPQVQTVVSTSLSVFQWFYIVWRLPFNSMSKNIGQIVAELGQVVTLAIPLLGHYEMVAWEGVAGLMIFLNLGTTGFTVFRQISGLGPGLALGALNSVLGVPVINTQAIEVAEKQTVVITEHVAAMLAQALPDYQTGFDEGFDSPDHTALKAKEAAGHLRGMQLVMEHFGNAMDGKHKKKKKKQQKKKGNPIDMVKDYISKEVRMRTQRLIASYHESVSVVI